MSIATKDTARAVGPSRTGTVKWFNETKGFGFITADRGKDADGKALDGEDHFVHYKSIKGDGFRTLADGQRVTFISVRGPKGWAAENVVPA